MSITSLPPQAPLPMLSNPNPTGSNDPAPKQPPEGLQRDSLNNPRKPLHNETPESPLTAETPTTSEPSPDVIAKMNRITELLSPDSLIQMMRDPYARNTAQSLKDMRELLSEESLNTLTSDPAEMSRLRDNIGQLLSEKHIQARQAEAAVIPNPNLTQERIRERTRKVDPTESYVAYKQIETERQQEHANAQQRIRLSTPLSKNLMAIGKPFQNAETDRNPAAKSKPLQPKEDSTPSGIDKNPADANTGASADAVTKMNRINHLLSRDSLIQMLREPDSEQTTQRKTELQELLSEDSLKTLATDPVELAKLKNTISQIFSETHLQALQREADAMPTSAPPKAETDSNPSAKSKVLQPKEDSQPSSIDESPADANTKASADAITKMNRINHLLSRDSLIQMLREPGSEETAQRGAELQELLSEDSLKTLATDPAELAKLKNTISETLSEASLEALKREAATLPGSAPPTAQVHKDAPQPETDSSAELAPADPGNTAVPRPAGTPQIFSYNDLSANPGAVMSFTSGTDKIDLSGIRTQLGEKPLPLVERFSGVSGEMTINYYAGSNTSFVTISRKPGEPPFELKVLGEVRYRDIQA